MQRGMQELTIEQLGQVQGGEGSDDSFSQPSLYDSLTQSPSANFNPIVGPPGTQYFENDHSGPSANQRANDAFDNSTRVMRTFNDTFGWTTKSPGFGR